MLVAAFALYVVVILGATAAALFLPRVSAQLLYGLLCFVVVGGFALLWIYRRRPGEKMSRVVKAYLERLETVVRDSVSSKSTDKQVREMASYLHRELEFDAVCVLSRRRSDFLPIETFGADEESLRKVKVFQRDPLIQALEARQSVIEIAVVYQTEARRNPFQDTPLRHVVPVISSRKCSHLILVSENANLPFGLLRPFLLALSDQIGAYRLLEDTRRRNGQQVAKLKSEQRKIANDLKLLRQKGSAEAKTMAASQARLMRIFDREQLYPALLELLAKNYGANVTVVFAAGTGSDEYGLRYQRGKPDSRSPSPTIRSGEAIIRLLGRNSGPTAVSSLAETLIHHPEIESLKDIGVSHLSLQSDTKLGKVLVGIGRSQKGFSEDEIEGIRVLCALFDLVLTNIGHFERIEELSHTDPMTGLYNYRYFYKRLREEVFRGRRFSRNLALVIFDIDGFKVFNDTYGHQSGDYLLEQLGSLLSGSVRSIDVVSRYGGEEFCVIMPEADHGDCQNFMERMRVKVMNHEFQDKFTNDNHRITVSLGGAIYPNDAQRVDRLIYCADMALLEAKGSGRNKAFMFDKSFAEKKQAL